MQPKMMSKEYHGGQNEAVITMNEYKIITIMSDFKN